MPSTPAQPPLDPTLLPPGTHLDESGVLVIPMPAPVIFIPGQFTREDLSVMLDDQGITFRIHQAR